MKILILGTNSHKKARGASAVGGERGVDKLFEILAEETRVAMALTGCASLADISKDVVTRRCL